MNEYEVDILLKEYADLKEKHDKLCAFLLRVEEGSSPLHDDYPVGELYEQKDAMSNYLCALRARLAYEGVKVGNDDDK